MPSTTVRDLVRLGRGLMVGCRRCGTTRAPILENVAARIGYDTRLGPDVVFLCARCGSRDTTVTETSATAQKSAAQAVLDRPTSRSEA
jgi:hypothetical protein